MLRSLHVRDESHAAAARGEDAIYFDAAKNRYVGSVSLGYGPDGKRIRRKVFGKTKQEVRDRLKALHQELDAGVRSSSTYTVREAVDDWLREGLDGTSERTRTLYEGLLGPLLEVIGARPLRDLSAGDVRSALGKLAARYSTRSLQITRQLAGAGDPACRGQRSGRAQRRGPGEGAAAAAAGGRPRASRWSRRRPCWPRRRVRACTRTWC